MPSDNRIRFDAPLIDFATSVGLSGQAHDDYPAPNSQARFDHLRSYLIGLLSSQSSITPPTQYREGTVWFDASSSSFKVRFNDAWTDIAEVIKLDATTLKSWYTSLNSVVESAQSELYFQTQIVSPNVTLIPIPSEFKTPDDLVVPGSIVLVYINGQLFNPLIPVLQPNHVSFPDSTFSIGDTVDIFIKYIPSNKFNRTVQLV